MNSNFSSKESRSLRKSFSRSSSSQSQNHKEISSSRSRHSEGGRSQTIKKTSYNFKDSPFPSQNPYTARRPHEPRMPEGITWDMLSAEDKARLRGLSKEHAENIGLHMLAAYFLEDEDQQWALEHAKWIAHQASRVELARETLGLIAYRAGDYKLAARELRTALRMNGEIDYLPFIADCERGLRKPEKAIEIGNSEMAQKLRGPEKAEMMLVMAGAYADMKDFKHAIDITGLLLNAQGVSGEYRMRAAQAQQYFLEEAGQLQKAQKLDDLIEKLEDLYADDNFTDSDELLIDNDLESMSEDEVEKLSSGEKSHKNTSDKHRDDYQNTSDSSRSRSGRSAQKSDDHQDSSCNKKSTSSTTSFSKRQSRSKQDRQGQTYRKGTKGTQFSRKKTSSYKKTSEKGRGLQKREI